MGTLKQFVCRYCKNDADAERLTRSLMEWLRESRIESRDSLDGLRRKLDELIRPFGKPSDLEEFFASENPPFDHFRAVMCILGLRFSKMCRILLDIPDDPFWIPPHLQDQIRRSFILGNWSRFIAEDENNRSAERN